MEGVRLHNSAVGSTLELQQRIEKIYDHLYANASMRTPAGISAEVGKVLHAAMFKEEHSAAPAFQFGRSELATLMNGGTLLENQLANEVRRWFKDMNAAWGLYDGDVRIALDDFDIGYVCAQLDGIAISDRGRDVFGDALEIFRSQWAKRVGGQFFTDQRVAALAVALLRFDPRQGDDLVDICAGTGGFLLAGLNHIAELLEEQGHFESSETDVVSLAADSLKGQEVDSEVSDVANATLQSRMGTLRNPLVVVGDSLKPGAFGTDHLAGIQSDSHLCAATNPPFGTKITVKDPKVLQQFDLASAPQKGVNGRGGNKGVSPRAPDILLLEQNVRLLKPGIGRLAIVLPYQILSGPQTLYIREWLLRHVQLLAVIDLPAETFQPHTGTKAALVVIKRRERPLRDHSEIADPSVFMSAPKWIGHDRRGYTVYRRTEDGKLTGEILTDFPEVRAAFKSFERNEDPSLTHSLSFRVEPEALTKDPLLRMNASFHRTAGSQEKRSSALQRQGWKTARIQDVVDNIFYPGRFKRNYVDRYPAAVPFLGGANISQLIVTTDKWLSHNDPKLESLRVSAGWLLVTRSGSTGIVSSVPPAWEGFAISEHVIRIVPNSEKLDPAYIQAFLRSEYGQEQLSRGVFGSVIDEITPEHIGQIEMLIPTTTRRMEDIVGRVKQAEDARQLAIESLSIAVTQLNDWL